MSAPIFDELALATREELAAEIINRTKTPALVIFGEDDSECFRCYQSFAEGEGVSIAGLLRMLAAEFEDAEYCPGEDGRGHE